MSSHRSTESLLIPVARIDRFGRIYRTLRTKPNLTDEEFGMQLAFEVWCKKHQYQSPQIDELTAIHIFRDEIPALCHDHPNDPVYRSLLSRLKDQNALKWQQKVKRAKNVPIEALVRSYGYEPNRSGFIQSPFMPPQRTGSLKLYTANNTWYDHAAGKGGDTIQWVMEVKGVKFKEAVDYLI